MFIVLTSGCDAEGRVGGVGYALSVMRLTGKATRSDTLVLTKFLIISLGPVVDTQVLYVVGAEMIDVNLHLR